MRIVSMVCPHCGASLQLDADQKNLKCEYCDNSIFVDDEIKRIQFDNAEESGYLFEKGRQRAKAEYAREYQHTINAYTYEKPKKRRTWLWVLGWLCIFPVPLTILMIRNQKLDKKVKIAIIVIAWLIYFIIGRSRNISDSNRSRNTDKSTRSSTVETSIESDTDDDAENEDKSTSYNNIEKENKQQKNGFGKNSEVTVGAYSFSIPTYWEADIEEADYYRAYAETSGKVAMLSINSSFDEEDPVTYEILAKETESGEMSKAFSYWFDECGEVTIESFDNGVVKGFTYEMEVSIKGLGGKAVIVTFPDENNNQWVTASLCESNNTEYSYTEDFEKIIYSIAISDNIIYSDSIDLDTKEQNAEEVVKEETVTDEKKGAEMPVFTGSSLDTAVKKASEYGVIELFDDDFGYGTHCMSLSNSGGGLMIDIIYVVSTNEIMCAIITTNNSASSSDQASFVKGMASVLCPLADKDNVTSWVNDNVGGEKTTIIGGFTYEVSLGPTYNVLYYAGNSEWEEWELSH